MERFLNRPEGIRTRIKRNQNRAVSVGIFYWVGIFLFLCFSIFPYLRNLNGFNEMNGELWLVTFMAPITALLSSSSMTSDVLIPAVVAILYVLMVISTLFGVISATAKLIRITKRNPTNKWGYNRAAISMKLMAKRFARAFFMMFALTVLGVFALDGKPTLFFYIAFGIALLVHFIANFRRVKVSYFEESDDRFNPVERRSNVRRGASVLRNAWQIISIVAIVLLADEVGSCAPFFGILDGQELAIMPALIFGILVFLLPAIAHATSTKEYNGFGEKKKGVKTCRRCAFMIALLGLAGTIMTVVAPATEDANILPIAGIFGVALFWFIMELILSPVKKEKKEKKEKEPRKKKEKKRKKAFEEFVSGVVAEEPVEEKVEEKVQETEEEVEEGYYLRDPRYYVSDFLETPDLEAQKPLKEEEEDFTALLTDSNEDSETLRNKWLNMEIGEVDETEPTLPPEKQLLSAQAVNCPFCETLLYVRFGCKKAKCSKCGTVFEMKKRPHRYF